jgi:DNA-binding MarR family transcriptional regulator
MSEQVPTPTARRLRDAVRRLVVAHGALEEMRRPCGTEMSISHAYALLELQQHEGPITVSALAERLAIDRTNVSRLCARMEELGELVREVHPEDKRAVALRLTARGRKAAGNVDAASARHFDRLARRLDGRASRIARALEQLSQAMVSRGDEEQS